MFIDFIPKIGHDNFHTYSSNRLSLLTRKHTSIFFLFFFYMIVHGGSRISGKGVHIIYKGVGVCFADFYLIFIEYLMKMK